MSQTNPHPGSVVDPRQLRNAFGKFATGVTVVTCRTPDGTPHGATVNAFTAVSLDPPLAQV
ncbi:flavin reductase family protein, partial [Escherichia coli]|uniref:flavin reductase family protein n=1 Tax=Escherichia coli TaxID=562 RepID=UPI001ED9F67C